MSTINRPPVNIDVPDFPDEGNNPDDTCIGDALDDNQRRWLVIGICIHSIISPPLRQFVAPKFQQLYQTLCANESIHTQTYGNHLRNYPVGSRIRLNYEAINNNGRKPIHVFDYAVRNEVELSKLFLQTSMAFHTGFDHTCDTSALLTFLTRVDDFEVGLKNCAEKFRNEVRNPWAHCNFRSWKRQTYINAFQVMTDFVCSLGLPAAEETGIKQSIIEWKTDGENFLTGSTLGLELVRCTAKEISDIQRYIRNLAEQTKANFEQNIDDLIQIQGYLSKFEKEFKRIYDQLQHHTEVLDDYEKRISNTEKTLQNQQEVVSKHNTQIEKNEDDIQGLRRMVQDIPTASIGKKTLPKRRRGVVSRREYIKKMENYLLISEKSENKIALCGLGGIGKTYIVIEYASMTQTEYYQGGVFWFSGQNGEAFENSIRSIAEVIGKNGNNLTEMQENTFDWISHRQERCLIVIDNVDEENIHASIEAFITEHERFGQNNHLIITTRRREVKAQTDFRCSKCLTVLELSDTEGIQLLQRVLENESDENINSLKALSGNLCGLPLAIEQAATAINSRGLTVSKYVEEFQKKRIQVLDIPIPPVDPQNDDINRKSVLTTWEINARYIREKARSSDRNSAVNFMFHFLSYIASDDIPVQMINEGKPEVKDEQLREIFRFECRKNEVIILFTEYSLLGENSDGTLRIHPLVQEFIRFSISLENSNLRNIAECSVAMLRKVCGEALDKTENIALCARLGQHCSALKYHFQNMEDIVKDIKDLESFVMRCKCLNDVKKRIADAEKVPEDRRTETHKKDIEQLRKTEEELLGYVRKSLENLDKKSDS